MGPIQARLAATEAQGRITGVDVELVLPGPLDDTQVAKLRAAAETCRISRALAVPVTLRVTVCAPGGCGAP
jgi:organic hydroperoxide reductase OsmC/OhrA